MSDSVLSALRVGRSYGSVEAIREVSLDIARNEFVAVVGPSGCGKTTLLSLLSGYDQPTRGTIQRKGSARTIYQNGGLLPWLTAEGNIELGLRHVSKAAERKRQLRELLSIIELEEFASHYPHQLSGGMGQRVELARALAGDTDILLMDEPFSALDYLGRLRMRQELCRILQRRPCTVVFVTHDIQEAAQLCDRVIVLTERPARIACELRIDLPRPRSVTHPLVVESVHRILSEMGLENESAGIDELAMAVESGD